MPLAFLLAAFVFLHLMVQTELQGESLQLLPEKAIWWQAQKTLIVADLHWGKAAHFRKNGIAIPTDTQSRDQQKLAALISSYKTERLIIAGDLFHSKANNETEAIADWRKQHSSLHIDLVCGNHDILPEESYTKLAIQLHKECLSVASFTISHDLTEDSKTFTFHGHVHPAIRMKGKGSQSIKLPCFAQTERSFMLPAFGAFTGTHVLNENGYKHIYVVAEDKVLQWK